MALTTRGKVLYSATFLVLVPSALIAWAWATSSVALLPAIQSRPLGIAFCVVGAALLLAGMRDLWTHGGGLPMNAHPPVRYVDRGVYRLVPHPIYTGFCFMCVGVSVWVGSASGLWLISPVAALGCAALVLGYERHDLRERFGREPLGLLPQQRALPATLFDRLACYAFVLLPWLALYFVITYLIERADSVVALVLLAANPFWTTCATVLIASAFVGFVLAPLVPRTQDALRGAALLSLAAMGFAFAWYLFLPLVMPLGQGTSFPSIPLIWALLFAETVGRRWRSLGWVLRGWALLVAISCLAISLADWAGVVGAFASVALAAGVAAEWRAIRAAAERIANSWKDWRIGPVRVINHGAYAGMGAFLAIWIDLVLAGPGPGNSHLIAILAAATAGVVGAALWAQFVEGSPQLLRPYGFYGGLLGGTLGALAAPLFHTSIWLVLGVFSASGALAQAAGRLRCLVQGCCHGRPAPVGIGIRYRRATSRVCRFTAWTNVPLHPTPVYSILWNCGVTLLLFRLWSAHASLHLITGLYFILTGLGRFVEEAWRGEPQTKIVAGLRLYQWAAVASVVLGALFTAFDNGELAPEASWSWEALLPAIGFGFMVFCAMGVDFPESKRRFSRLA